MSKGVQMWQRSKRGRASEGEDRPESQRIQIRLYPEDLERIDALIAAGYGANRSEVIRRSIAETAKWTLSR